MDDQFFINFDLRRLVAHSGCLIDRYFNSNNKEPAMSDLDNSLFVTRDRTRHPRALTPDYKTSVARSPQ